MFPFFAARERLRPRLSDVSQNPPNSPSASTSSPTTTVPNKKKAQKKEEEEAEEIDPTQEKGASDVVMSETSEPPACKDEDQEPVHQSPAGEEKAHTPDVEMKE